MLAYLKEGRSKAQVSQLTFTAPDRVYAWLKRFREQGIEGLREKPRSGKPGLLDRSAYDALQQKIEDSQSSLSGGRLRGEDIIQLVKDEWGVEYTLSGIYRLMKAIGMSWGFCRKLFMKIQFAYLWAQLSSKARELLKGSFCRDPKWLLSNHMRHLNSVQGSGG